MRGITTDNKRELACRREKEKGDRLLSDGEGEETNSFSELHSERPLTPFSQIVHNRYLRYS
jgi:hypothetical protein